MEFIFTIVVGEWHVSADKSTVREAGSQSELATVVGEATSSRSRASFTVTALGNEAMWDLVHISAKE